MHRIQQFLTIYMISKDLISTEDSIRKTDKFSTPRRRYIQPGPSAWNRRIQTTRAPFKFEQLSDDVTHPASTHSKEIKLNISDSRPDIIRGNKSTARGSIPGKVNNFQSSETSRPTVASMQSPAQRILGSLFWRAWPFDYSILSNSGIKNERTPHMPNHIGRNKYKRVYSDGKQEDCYIANEETGANMSRERDRSKRCG